MLVGIQRLAANIWTSTVSLGSTSLFQHVGDFEVELFPRKSLQIFHKAHVCMASGGLSFSLIENFPVPAKSLVWACLDLHIDSIGPFWVFWPRACSLSWKNSFLLQNSVPSMHSVQMKLHNARSRTFAVAPQEGLLFSTWKVSHLLRRKGSNHMQRKHTQEHNDAKALCKKNLFKILACFPMILYWL